MTPLTSKIQRQSNLSCSLEAGSHSLGSTLAAMMSSRVPANHMPFSAMWTVLIAYLRAVSPSDQLAPASVEISSCWPSVASTLSPRTEYASAPYLPSPSPCADDQVEPPSSVTATNALSPSATPTSPSNASPRTSGSVSGVETEALHLQRSLSAAIGRASRRGRGGAVG